MSENLPTIQPDSRPISIRDGAGLLSVEQQTVVLAEYDKRRNHFLKWLFAHLKEGIHYGFPPGCECKYDDSGALLQWSKTKNAYTPIPPSQWIPKPSLYKGGAQLVIDLLKLKTSYENDTVVWEMAGKPQGVIFRKCILADSLSSTVVGEGTGAFSVGQKGMDANAAIKMSDKRAMVAAVLNGVSVLGELFTQDVEDKLAERRKGNIKERQMALLGKVTKMLIEGKSKYSGEPADWLRDAIKAGFGPTGKISSSGAVDEFEKLLDAKSFNIHTAEKIK